MASTWPRCFSVGSNRGRPVAAIVSLSKNYTRLHACPEPTPRARLAGHKPSKSAELDAVAAKGMMPEKPNHHLAFAPWATGSNSGSRVTTELIVRGRRFLCGCFRSTCGSDLIETSTVAVERRLRCSELLPTFYRDIHIFR